MACDSHLLPMSSGGRPSMSVCALTVSPCEDTSPTAEPTHMTLSALGDLCEDPVSKYGRILRSRGEDEHVTVWGDTRGQPEGTSHTRQSS